MTGKLVIPVQFDDVSSFAEGLAAARKGKVWSYIDSAGAEVISGKYKELRLLAKLGQNAC